MKDKTKRIPVGEFTTIYKRGEKGIYTADFHHNGKHCRRSLYTNNLKVARKRAVELERQILNGEPVVPTTNGKSAQDNIRPVIDEFLAHLETEDRRPKTLKKYRGILENFASFAQIQNMRRLADADMRIIDKFRAHRKPLIGPKSMHNEGVVLKGFFEWCRLFHLASNAQVSRWRSLHQHQEAERILPRATRQAGDPGRARRRFHASLAPP